MFSPNLGLLQVHVLRLTAEHRPAGRMAQDQYEARLREELRAASGTASASSAGGGSLAGGASTTRMGTARPATDSTARGSGGRSADSSSAGSSGGVSSGGVSSGGSGGVADEGALDAAAVHERRAKEAQRDRAMRRVLAAPASAGVERVLGLPRDASDAEVMQAIRLAMRLLHPDRSLNLGLRDTPAGRNLEAAFKKINNVKDVFEKR